MRVSQSAADNGRQRRGSCKATVRRFHTNENLPTLTSRTVCAQVRCDRLANIRRQRHSIMKQSLTSDVNLAGPPVDVFELERYYLTSAKTETGKQKKDCVVASSGRRFLVTGSKQPLHF